MTNKINKINRIYILLFIFSVLFFPAHSFAAEFMTSWQANSYAPRWFSGKIFPTFGSLVNVSFELIDNGRITDLSRVKVRWYLNDKLVKNEKNGLGIKNYSFINSVYGGNDAEIRISIPDYKTGPLDEIIRIPVKEPEVAIDAPYFNQSVNKGANGFLAHPFFFNISDVSEFFMNWTIDGKSVGDNSKSVPGFNLNIGQETAVGTKINLGARISNIKNQLEFASKTMTVEVK